MGTCRVSPDHKFLAYTLDITGNEQFLLQVKDLSNGYIVSRSQVDGVVSLAWAQDSTTLFYTVSDENQRPYRVLFTKLGSDEIDDVPVFKFLCGYNKHKRWQVYHCELKFKNFIRGRNLLSSFCISFQ